MTLAEFQPYVEKAMMTVERSTAGARRMIILEDERDSILRAIQWVKETEVCTHCGERHCEHIENLREQLEPMHERLRQLSLEMTQEVTEDVISPLPLRSVPMDLITEVVARRLLRLPAEFPILSIKTLPSERDIEGMVRALANRWRTSNGQAPAEEYERS